MEINGGGKVVGLGARECGTRIQGESEKGRGGTRIDTVRTKPAIQVVEAAYGDPGSRREVERGGVSARRQHEERSIGKASGGR